LEAEIRNAVLDARREAQAQHSSVTNQLEKLRLEAENEAAQAHEMLASESAALKATRREVFHRLLFFIFFFFFF
jgi:F0F1-type ATP synthase membrane subunit b/b'